MTTRRKRPSKAKTETQAERQDRRQLAARLAAEGKTSSEIAKEFKVSRTTVNNWLRTMRPKTSKTPDHADELFESIEFFKAMRKELMAEWRQSKAVKEVSVVEKTGPADGPAEKLKTSVRTETRTGNVSYFRAVMNTQDRIDSLEAQFALLQDIPAKRADRLAYLTDEDLEELSDDDLDNFTSDELYAMELRLRAKHEREGQKFDRPVLTNEQIGRMVEEELEDGGRRSEDGGQKSEDGGQRPEDGGPAEATKSEAAEAKPAKPMTWDEQHTALLHEKWKKDKERKERLKPWTDPVRCAFR